VIEKAGSSQGISTAVAALARHDERRHRGVPTVSVLVAPISAALQVASSWAESLCRPMVFVRSEAPGVEPVLAPWVARLAAERDLVADAITWLGRKSGRSVEQLVQSLGEMTPHEVGLFLESALPLSSQTGAESVVCHLLGDAVSAGWRAGSEHRRVVRSLLQSCSGSWLGVYAALGEMVLVDDLPVLVVTPGRPEVSRLADDAKLLTSLAIAQPRAAILLVVAPGQFDAYVAMTPVSRARDLLCESVVKLSSGSGGLSS